MNQYLCQEFIHLFTILQNTLLQQCFFILKDNKINAICDLTDKELRFGHNLEKLYRGGTFAV